MKKKLFMLLMAMSLVLTACGGNAKEAEAEIEELEEALEDAEEALAEAEEALAEAESTEEAETEEAEEVTEDAEGFAKGVTTDDGWESKWLGLRYQAPENATMLTEKELDEIIVND